MCAKNPDCEPEIYMVSHYRGMKVDCYFTDGDIRRDAAAKYTAIVGRAKAAESIRAFVRSGGTVIADARAAHGRPPSRLAT